MTAGEMMAILRVHILPYCQTSRGDLPYAEDLYRWIGEGPFDEWTLDAIGKRDWKIDRSHAGRISVRYKGTNQSACVAARRCNAALKAVANGDESDYD